MIEPMDYLVLLLLWIAWCTLHSLLIASPVTGYFRHRLGTGFRFYRLAYNGLSVVTLIPLLLYAWSLRSAPLFSFHGPWRALQFLLLFISFSLFLSGLRRYDSLQFLGFRQLVQADACAVLTEDCTLDLGGVLGMVRHPWYTGGILIVWARDLDMAAILTNTVITGYFIVGAFLEERKLIAEFGERYKDYQKRVSMFLPFKWLRRKFLT